MDDARTVDVDEVLTPPEAEAPAKDWTTRRKPTDSSQSGAGRNPSCSHKRKGS